MQAAAHMVPLLLILRVRKRQQTAAIDTDTLSLAFSSSLNARPPLLGVARAWGLRTRVRHMLHKYVSSTQELYFRISLGISVVTSQSICFRSGGFMMIYHDGFQT